MLVTKDHNVCPNTYTFPDKDLFHLYFDLVEKEGSLEFSIQFTCCFVTLGDIQKVFEGNITKVIIWNLGDAHEEEGHIRIDSETCELNFSLEGTLGDNAKDASVKCVFPTHQMIAAIREEFDDHCDFQNIGKIHNIKTAQFS